MMRGLTVIARTTVEMLRANWIKFYIRNVAETPRVPVCDV